jgi:hypothetical protein
MSSEGGINSKASPKEASISKRQPDFISEDDSNDSTVGSSLGKSGDSTVGSSLGKSKAKTLQVNSSSSEPITTSNRDPSEAARPSNVGRVSSAKAKKIFQSIATKAKPTGTMNRDALYPPSKLLRGFYKTYDIQRALRFRSIADIEPHFRKLQADLAEAKRKKNAKDKPSDYAVAEGFCLDEMYAIFRKDKYRDMIPGVFDIGNDLLMCFAGVASKPDTPRSQLILFSFVLGLSRIYWAGWDVCLALLEDFPDEPLQRRQKWHANADLHWQRLNF